MRVAGLIAAVLVCATVETASAQSKAGQLHRIFSEYFEDELREHPEFATTEGRHQYDRLWTDWSQAAIERRLKGLERYRDRLGRFPLEGLSGQDTVSVRLLRYQLEMQISSEPLDVYLLRVFQMSGLHNHVYQTVDRMPARTAADYENIIARLSAVPVYVDQNIAVLDEAIRRGLVQPRIIAELVVLQLATQSAQTSDQTPLLAAFRKFPSSVPSRDQERLRRQAAAAYDQQFVPAWRKLHGYMRENYLPKSRESTALGSLPGGARDYAILVRRYTTTALTPQQIHRLGEQEVERIESDMKSVLRDAHFSGTVTEFERTLNADSAQHFTSKDEMLAYCRNIAKTVEPQLPKLFMSIPHLLYGVRAIPEDREAASASNAQAPTPDLSQPGWFNLNTYLPEKQVRYDKQALTLHEAVPGHVFQISRQQEAPGLPEFRRTFLPGTAISAYTEGWGLYAESLGAELGMYQDPYSRFGQLSSERFRAVRLVVDTGLHALGWTRAQALDYFSTHAPAQSRAEIDRYIAWPGQALAYKMGELKIKELRRRAENELGTNFSIREFHDVVLRNGSLPMQLLEEQVADYIQQHKTASGAR